MNRKGFTVVELIIVLGIIAVIGTLAAVSVNSARAKMRDATRLSQVRQVQAGLEEYFNESSAYPLNGETALPLGDGEQAACLGVSGFLANCSAETATFLRVVTPTIGTGLDGLSVCGNPPRNAYCYISIEGGAQYRIQFELETNWTQAGLAKGLNCAKPEGMEAGACR